MSLLDLLYCLLILCVCILIFLNVLVWCRSNLGQRRLMTDAHPAESTVDYATMEQVTSICSGVFEMYSAIYGAGSTRDGRSLLIRSL